MGMRAALIVDNDRTVSAWQARALVEAIATGDLEVTLVLRCTNSHSTPRRRQNLAYYALALFSRRGLGALARVPVADAVGVEVPTVDFESIWDGNWQRVPDSLHACLETTDVALKFGMNLLRDPDDLPLRHGVLSYHHGDPTMFRGRPAGYYELSTGAKVQGVIVQRLSNTLDGGVILADAYSLVVPHSYRATLRNAYEAGVPLLRLAVRNAENGNVVVGSALGKNYRLPENAQVLNDSLRMLCALGSRIAYGAFRSKRWRLEAHAIEIGPEARNVVSASTQKPVPVPMIPPGAEFVADPHVAKDGSVFCEVLRRSTQTGEIWRLDRSGWQPVHLPGADGHLSYPQVVESDGERYLFPEMAEVGPPSLYRLNPTGTRSVEVLPLSGLEGERLLDGTLFHHDDTWWLFAGRRESANSQLRLWYAPRLLGPYHEHAGSPVCRDPRGARMAGPLFWHGGRIYRSGQDITTGYGSRITIHRVGVLSRSQYFEQPCGSVEHSQRRGPHTLSQGEAQVWIDTYTERWDPRAGLNRLRSRMRRGR